MRQRVGYRGMSELSGRRAPRGRERREGKDTGHMGTALRMLQRNGPQRGMQREEVLECRVVLPLMLVRDEHHAAEGDAAQAGPPAGGDMSDVEDARRRRGAADGELLEARTTLEEHGPEFTGQFFGFGKTIYVDGQGVCQIQV